MTVNTPCCVLIRSVLIVDIHGRTAIGASDQGDEFGNTSIVQLRVSGSYLLDECLSVDDPDNVVIIPSMFNGEVCCDKD